MTDDALHVCTNTVAQSSAANATVASPVPSGTPPMSALAVAGAESSGRAADIRAQGRSPAPRGGDAANVLDAPYNADPTGVADSTAAFTAALASGRRVVVPPGTYAVCGAIIPASAELEGAGRDLTVLKAKAGCNADVLLTAGAYSLFGTKSGGGANAWQVSRLSIDGNRAAQTARGAAIDGANCLAVYGAAWRLHEVTLRNCLGHGLRSEWGDGGPTGGLEASLYDVTIDTVGRHGWWFRGPHDIDAIKVIVIDASQEADNTYDGILNQSNGRFFDFHGWHRGVVTNRVAYQFYSALGSNQIIAAHIEGGRQQIYHGGFGYDQVIGSFIYAPFGGEGTALVTFASNNNIHVGNQYQGTSGTGAYALQFGIAGKPVIYNQVVSSHFAAFDTVGPFNFLNDGGTNAISGYGYANPKGVATIAGTVAASTRINYTQGGTGMSFSSVTPIAQIGDGSVANGNARGPGAVDLQTSRTQNFAVAAGANSGILSGSGNIVGGLASVIAGGSANGTGNASYSAVGGGQNNYATGNWSAVLGGQSQNAAGVHSGITYGANNTADGYASGANGLWASARGGYGVNAFANGRFSTAGDAQRREVLLRGTGSSTAAIRLTADGRAAGSANCVNIADATAYSLGIWIVVRSVTTPANSYTWSVPLALLLRVAGVGSTTLSLGTPTTLATNSFAPTVSATADTTLGCLNLSVTPPAGNTDTIRAVSRIESIEVQ